MDLLVHCARFLMMIAILNLSSGSFVTAASAADLRVKSKVSDTDKSGVSPKDITICLRAVDRQARKMGNRLPPIILEATQRQCSLLGDANVAIGKLADFAPDLLSGAEDKNQKSIEDQGYKGTGTVLEPGLLGLDGGQEMAIQILQREAKAIWALSSLVGGAPLPRDVLDIARSKKAPTLKVDRASNLEMVNGASLVVIQGDGTSGQAVAGGPVALISGDKPGSVDEGVAVSGQFLLENFVLSDGSASQSATNNLQFVQAYVSAYLTLLKSNPDAGTTLKLKVFKELKRAAFLPEAKRSPVEKRFVHAFEIYLSQQYIKMAQAAIAANQKYKQDHADRLNQSILARNYDLGSAPPDFFQIMGGSIALGSYAAATAGLIAAIDGGAIPASSAAIAIAQAKADALAVAALSNGASHALEAGATIGGTAQAEAAVGSAATSLGGGFVTATPIFIIVAAIITATLAVKLVIDEVNAEAKMNELISWVKHGKLRAKDLLATRQGTIQFEYFFAKATSSASPTGFTNPSEGCRVCFYKDVNFEGERVCTDGRIDDLNTAKLDQSVTAETAKMRNKVSSVGMDQTSCPDSYAVLYSKPKFQGERVILREAVPDLSVLSKGKSGDWNNAASSVSFANKDAPKCEVCMFNKANFEGLKYCTAEPIAKLAPIGMADKITSVLFNTADCPDARVWLYKKKGFQPDEKGGGVTRLTESSSDLGKGIRNNASSIYFDRQGQNPFEVKASGGCRACLYDSDGFGGDYLCVNENIPDMGDVSVAGTKIKFKNKASSIQFIQDDCQAGEVLQLELYSNENYTGQMTRYFGQSISKLTGREDNSARSAKLTHYDPTKQCRVCLFEEEDYQGEKHCLSKDEASLWKPLAGKVSSILVENGACAGGGAILYDKKGFKGTAEFALRSYPTLKELKRGGNSWDNALLSIKFDQNAAKAKADAEAAAAKAAKLPAQPKQETTPRACQVCLFADPNFRGKSVCLTKDSPKLEAALSRKVSSIKLDTGTCPAGGAIIYSKPGFKGSNAFVMGNLDGLSRIPGSKDKWDNKISSIRFSNQMLNVLYKSMKAATPLASDAKVKKAIKDTYGR